MARPSSTVILARPAPFIAGGQGFQVFMVRRPVKSEFAADVYVFPGGALRPDDLDPEIDALCRPFDPTQALRLLGERGGTPPSSAREAQGLWVAALRELYEEAGVLLAEPLDDHRTAGDAEARTQRITAARNAVQSGAQSLAALLRQERLRPACEQLVYFSHWITPRPYPRRFDTRFFLALMPNEQEALHCEVETVASAWVTPQQALAGFADGTFPLVFPTQRHLERIAHITTWEELERFARSKPIRTVEVEAFREGGLPCLPEGLEGCW